MPLLKKVQGGYILHTEKRFFDLDSMKKMQKTRRKWHETKVFSFGSVCHMSFKQEKFIYGFTNLYDIFLELNMVKICLGETD